MSELKRKCQVVMLPTQTKSKIGLNPSALGNKPHLYYFEDGPVYNEMQHLYVVSDENGKGGEWVYQTVTHLIIKAPFDYIDDPRYKKVIATTDSNLTIPVTNPALLEYGKATGFDTTCSGYRLPSLSKSFIQKYIEQYNAGTPITEVMVEYEYRHRNHSDEYTDNYDSSTQVKLRNGEIIITKIKDIWTRAELESIMSCYGAQVVLAVQESKPIPYYMDYIK